MENNNSHEEMTKLSNQSDKLLLQLHEQYAQNNNANLSSVIGLITAVIAIIGFYGYVYVYSSLDFAKDLGSLVNCDETFTMDVLLLMTIATFIVIGILQYICLYQGCHQRYEQFITHAIRCKSRLFPIKKENGSKDEKIFPNGYHPFEKDKNSEAKRNWGDVFKAMFLLNRGMKRIVQGLFGELVIVFSIIMWVVGVATLSKCALAVIAKEFHHFSGVIMGCAVLIVIAVNLLVTTKALDLKHKYLKFCKEYETLNPLKEASEKQNT